MVFNSLTFLVFFGLVLAVHQSRFGWRPRKVVLLVASYLFYAAWNPPFVVLLGISTACDWFVARAMGRAPDGPRRKLLLVASLTVNLGMLAFFKYGTFAVENTAAVLGSLGVAWSPPSWDIVLPVGISFYTFQTLSYTIDVYRRRLAPWPSPLDFALFVSFFPQLVAGPIVRASHFLPQLARPRRASSAQIGWGLSLLALGLFEKVLLADALLAPVADAVYDVPHRQGPAGAWVGTLAFAGQIFFDFSGYSTCAIGVALCLGFGLPDNFRFPYAALGFSDFWRRWHISLSTWLRDYLYIPLGGNRRGPARTQANLMLTMLLGGLWHGASWRFVAWGGLHGLYLVAERGIVRLLGGRRLARTRPARILGVLATFGLVCVTWVFFRATDFESAFTLVQAMCGQGAARPIPLRTDQTVPVLVVVGGLLAAHGALRDTTLEAVTDRTPAWARSTVTAALLVGCCLAGGGDRAFLYFQF